MYTQEYDSQHIPVPTCVFIGLLGRMRNFLGVKILDQQLVGRRLRLHLDVAPLQLLHGTEHVLAVVANPLGPIPFDTGQHLLQMRLQHDGIVLDGGHLALIVRLYSFHLPLLLLDATGLHKDYVRQVLAIGVMLLCLTILLHQDTKFFLGDRTSYALQAGTRIPTDSL